MGFEPSQFVLDKPPVAVVTAQFELRNPVSQLVFDRMRGSLKPLGLDRHTRKSERRWSFAPPSIEPKVQDIQSLILLDAKSTRGMSVAGNTMACFTGQHKNFRGFLGYLEQIVASSVENGHTFEATSIALRYVNVFEVGDTAESVVRESLCGLGHANLGTEHHHHNYEFWCDTEPGRLTLRYSTTHGDRKPTHLGHADAVFPTDFLQSYDVIVGHLDIFMSTGTLKAAVDWASSKTELQKMNVKIEQAFLNAINEKAMIERFGARRSDRQ